MAEESLEERVKAHIQKIRPQLQMDGGDVELVEVEENGNVKVRLLGHCNGCAYATQTLKLGIQRYLQQNIPEVTNVEGVQ